MAEHRKEDGLEAAPETADRTSPELWAHVVPFVAWLFLMQMLGDPAGWKYAVRSVACLALLFWLKPWRGYGPLRWSHLPLAFAAGVVVFVVWIGPETGWFSRFPVLQRAYLRWGIMPMGKLPEPLTSFPYAPETCGWPLAIARLLGSALVIGTIEEFFWRGFLYRWMFARDFMKVDLGKLHWGFLVAVSVVFGLEHDRWLVGVAAGLIYGWVAVRTRDIWAAAIAHIVTNFVLGVYVLLFGAYRFW